MISEVLAHSRFSRHSANLAWISRPDLETKYAGGRTDGQLILCSVFPPFGKKRNRNQSKFRNMRCNSVPAQLMFYSLKNYQQKPTNDANMHKLSVLKTSRLQKETEIDQYQHLAEVNKVATWSALTPYTQMPFSAFYVWRLLIRLRDIAVRYWCGLSVARPRRIVIRNIFQIWCDFVRA